MERSVSSVLSYLSTFPPDYKPRVAVWDFIVKDSEIEAVMVIGNFEDWIRLEHEKEWGQWIESKRFQPVFTVEKRDDTKSLSDSVASCVLFSLYYISKPQDLQHCFSMSLDFETHKGIGVALSGRSAGYSFQDDRCGLIMAVRSIFVG